MMNLDNFKVLKTTTNSSTSIHTNYLIDNDGNILSRKHKKVEPTINNDGNKEVILMINGRAYKKTLNELISENF